MISRLKDTLLLVGDGTSDRVNLREIFESSYDLLEAENVAQALMLLKQNISCIAAILADIPLADDESVRALSSACSDKAEYRVPVMLLIDPADKGEEEERAFALGATDVVHKPYTPSGIIRRLQVLVDMFLNKWNLEKVVAQQNEAIRNTNQVVLDTLSALIEHRSTESGNHVLRIRRFTKILLEDVAKSYPGYNLTDTEIEQIASASALHDIGKISIPDAILNKPGKLTDEEFEIMKTHTTVGSQLVQNLSGIGDEEFLRYAYNIALYHHERWDGGGYPIGLKGDEIPICAQVVGVADVFDALTTKRVYKPAYPYQRAINMILNGECGVFDPKLLECFKHVREHFVELAIQYEDGYSPKSDSITIPLPGPVWQKPKLDSLQLSQVKYQTLLHYVNDTVIEFDLDHKLYHMVYNPNLELESLILNAPYEEVVRCLLDNDIHPGDKEIVDEMQRYFSHEFFEQDLRRKSFRCRMYSAAHAQYFPYEITLLRANTQNRDQRIVIVVFHKVEDNVEKAKAPLPTTLHSSPALYGLVSSALRCRSDKYMTIDAGAKDLYTLTGYTEEEIQSIFGGRYTELIFPDDRAALSDAIQSVLHTSGMTENEYRLVRKDGTTLWVLDKSRAYVEADGQLYVYHAVRDNSLSKATYHKLKATIERNQVIIDQSGGIVFEWDLLKDKLECSSRWEEHFGYPPVSENYGRQLGIATHFHPDDLLAIRSAVEQIKNHADTICLDVRIANSEAKYLWTRITATAYLDENGVLTRIVGVLQDVDALKRAELALKERAERDSLTKLLNKASTQQLVTEYLSDKDKDSLSAMLILDLDNFKLINDNYGHLYGDAVLAQVGAALKKLFRVQDFIGRIGGDEFLVFMRDIPNTELVHSRCQLILDNLREILTRNAAGLNVSCSIGTALVPNHGVSYTELFRHADEALYLSKSRGKNTYTVYDPNQNLAVLPDNMNMTTRIDSDEEPGMADASFVRYIFRRLYESDDIISTIDNILTYIGEQLNVSRVYVFENNDDNTSCSNTFEWCNEGITPEKDNLQNVSYITDIQGWPEVYDEKGVFYCTDITQLAPQFREILEPQGIKSMLQCAIMDQGVFRGYVGFDECSVNRMWTQEQINLLEFFAEVLAMFLLKKRTQDRAVAVAESLRHVLDQQDDWIYVIDHETCELKFLNAKAKKLAADCEIGMACYNVFMGRKCRCENCPAAKEDGTGTVIIDSYKYGVKVRANSTKINWNGKEACLITCRELT